MKQENNKPFINPDKIKDVKKYLINKIAGIAKSKNEEEVNIKQHCESIEALDKLEEKLELDKNRNEGNIELNFSTFIPKFAMLHYSFNKSLYKVIPSPRGLGKTYNSAKIWLKYLIEENNNDMTWFRHYEKDTSEFLKIFRNIIDEENLYHLCNIRKNSTSGYVEVYSKVTNSILDFRGAYSLPSLKGIEGKNKFLFDEATQFEFKSILKLIGSVKNKEKEEHWFLFNLGTDEKYIKTNPDKFIKAMKENNAFILTLKQEDNIYATKEYFSKLEGFKYFDEESYYEATGKKIEKEKKETKKEEFKIKVKYKDKPPYSISDIFRKY